MNVNRVKDLLGQIRRNNLSMVIDQLALLAIEEIEKPQPKLNSGKYKIENNQIVNIQTGIAIPEDEPVFILRGQDIYAPETIAEYSDQCANPELAKTTKEISKHFFKWQEKHEDRVKTPD